MNGKTSEPPTIEQERGMRSGTLATPPIVGFGAAAEVSRWEFRLGGC